MVSGSRPLYAHTPTHIQLCPNGWFIWSNISKGRVIILTAPIILQFPRKYFTKPKMILVYSANFAKNSPQFRLLLLFRSNFPPPGKAGTFQGPFPPPPPSKLKSASSTQNLAANVGNVAIFRGGKLQDVVTTHSLTLAVTAAHVKCTSHRCIGARLIRFCWFEKFGKFSHFHKILCLPFTDK